MGKKQSTPEYPTTTISSGGLFGSSTTSKKGSSFNPTAFQQELVGITEQNAPKYLSEYLNPDYNSESFRQADNYFKNQAYNNLQNNYLNSALANGLLRGSTAQDVYRGFAQDLANTEYERQRDYRDQQLQNYQAAMLPYTTIYDMVNGSQGLSASLNNSIANYNLQKAQMDKSGSSGLGSILGGMSSIGSLMGGLGGNK